MQVIAATKNKGKLQELREILGGYFDIISMDEAGIEIDVVEDGTTFEENAIKKAVEIMKESKKAALADDSGLEVDYLSNAPGVYSARYAGENASDADRNNKLLSALDGVEIEQRSARFVAVVALAFTDGSVISASGECEGSIGFEPLGEGGFGYDPIFIVRQYGKTFAQLDAMEKNKISHRGKAIAKLKNLLANSY